jgi:hypothetical protein
VLRKITQFTFVEESPGRPTTTWLKVIFEMDVQNTEYVVLDPIEHQKFLFASEDEIINDRVGDVEIRYISPQNKTVKLEAFRIRQEGILASA